MNSWVRASAYPEPQSHPSPDLSDPCQPNDNQIARKSAPVTPSRTQPLDLIHPPRQIDSPIRPQNAQVGLGQCSLPAPFQGEGWGAARCVWDEIDLHSGMCTRPNLRTKNAKPH